MNITVLVLSGISQPDLKLESFRVPVHLFSWKFESTRLARGKKNELAIFKGYIKFNYLCWIISIVTIVDRCLVAVLCGINRIDSKKSKISIKI